MSFVRASKRLIIPLLLNHRQILIHRRVDLMQLIEEAVEGCWIGHRARMSALNDSEIGSLYSPPKQDRVGTKTPSKHVEIVVDIGERDEVC